jgi:hypothetical protein
VDFGSGVNYFSIKAASSGSGGEVELRLDKTNGPVIGRAYFHYTGSPVYFIDYEAKLNQTITGQHDVYMNIQDYSSPSVGSILKLGEFKFSLANDNPVASKNTGIYVYPSVPGLAPSPYYELRVQEKSRLNATNLAAVTNWQSPFAWFTECPEKDTPNTTGGYFSGFIGGWSHTYTNFEISPGTPIVVKITRKATNNVNAPAGPIKRATAYPARNVLSTEIINGDVYITMDKPAQISVDIDGQMDTRNAPRATPDNWGSQAFPYNGRQNGSHAVSIFANPFITPPDKTAPGVLVIKAGQKLPANLSELNWNTLYFEPGIHRASVDVNSNGELVERRWKPEDQIPIISNRSYYIPGDAVVYGNFTDYNKKTQDTSNVKFYGHGTISGAKITHWKSWPDYPNSEYPNSEWHRGVVMRNAKNSHIEGVTQIEAANHNFEIDSNSTDEYITNSIKWTKVIGWRVNSDGASIGGRVTMEDSFMRTQDDSHYIGGAMPLRRMVFWNDVNGQAFRADFATDRIKPNDAPSFPKQIVIEDIDIIYARGVFATGDPLFGLVGAEGGFDGKILANGVVNTGQMIIFKNIMISDPLPNRALFSFNAKDKIGSYAGFRFENVTYAGNQSFGWKDQLLGGVAGLRNFVFDNVSFAGEKIDIDYINNPANFKTDRVFDLTFRTKDIVPSTAYTLTRTATNGAIKLTPLQSGSNQLTVSALPVAGYKFIGWSGDLSGVNSTATITINRDKAITANFAPK